MEAFSILSLLRSYDQLGQSPRNIAMCLAWQLVLMGNDWNWSLFLLGDKQLILWGGGGGQAVILAVKHLKMNILAWVPRKVN